eukprot:CAMPEP_0198490334 /NCGR_PEP_ID=MMETSP1462-20131121/2055_1 /TAXON_ID=1333877 /ORGANISM="Brandtodinium nutriculum, Strain RCC3387" /LENGTH=51 /DNA_ID=CAMNT_0044218883 /DNA_START=80 /DNA_END=231 /DNA_ORIENTATION=-
MAAAASRVLWVGGAGTFSLMRSPAPLQPGPWPPSALLQTKGRLPLAECQVG